MNYKQAGVDTEKAQKLISNLKGSIVSTHESLPTGAVGKDFGGFAGFFLPNQKFQGKNIVACTDGVGTKIQLCRKYGYLEGLGQDLVAMCVNDLYCTGATPAFFLDYMSCGKLDDAWYSRVMQSIIDACKYSQIALLGGETAEHPGVIADDDFDLAGFSVGFVDEKERLPKKDSIAAGDVLLGLPSSGIHSNGFSLVRKLLNELEQNNALDIDGEWVKKHLLRPTRIYKKLPELLNQFNIKAVAHITGGGLKENIPRILNDDVSVEMKNPFLDTLPVYHYLQKHLDLKVMYGTFNMGIGIVVVCDELEAEKILAHDLEFKEVGLVTNNKGKETAIDIETQ